MITKLNSYKNSTFIVVVLLILCSSAWADSCPQLCADCSNNPCVTCYDNWQSDASTYYSTNCSCPIGYYLNSTTKICNFCPVQCITCLNYTTCTQCLQGYRLSNGVCIANFINSTTQISLDLNNTSITQRSAYGFRFNNTGSTRLEANYFQYCSSSNNANKFTHQGMLGRYAFNYNSVIYKTYYGLPFHQWAMVKFQIFILDNWQDQSLIVEVELGRNQNSSDFTTSFFQANMPYNQGIRNVDFCGLNQYHDSLGIYNYSFPHTDSMLKFRVRTSLFDLVRDQLPPNYEDMYFGIRQILLIVGICPQNCLTCASRTRCGSCKQLYTLDTDTFKCICDTNIAIITQNNQCIKKCISGTQLMIDNKCKPCGQQFGGCLLCANRTSSQREDTDNIYKCIQCSNNKFLWNGQCVNNCPRQYYEQFLASGQICTRCPTGCQQCQNSQYYSSFTDHTNNLEIICNTCLEGYLWYNGQCFRNCPTGTYANNRRTICTRCSQGCLSCQSQISCTQCQTTRTLTTVYINQNGQCILTCISTNLPYNQQTNCPNTTCSTNCLTCFGNLTNQCTTCSSTTYLQDYSCVSSCSVGYYQLSPISKICVRCPSQCRECTEVQCMVCSFGFWLFNGRCIRLCPITYYPATINGVYRCLSCTDPHCIVCTQLTSSLATTRNTNSQCQQCMSGYYLDPTTGTCIIGTPDCPTTFYYSLEVKDCVKCPINCLQCQSTLCLLCSQDKILNNGVCVDQCPTEKIAVGFLTRNVSGVDVVYRKCIWSDPLCEVYTDGNCTECVHLDPTLILDTRPNSTQASCIFSCPDGYNRISPYQQTCTLPCPTNCLECDTNNRCTKCKPTYLIYLGNCIQLCPQYYFSDSIQCIRCDINCLRCQQDGKCIQCRDNSMILTVDGNCRTINCSISEYNITSNLCPSCVSPCASCTGRSTQCTSCITNYFLLSNSSCSLICDTNQFKDQISKTCRPCRPSCSSCTNFQFCTLCLPDYYLMRLTTNTAYCISQCPPGTFISVLSIPYSCMACKFPCRSCFGPNQNQCLECVSGYQMDYTTCVLNCPSGKYEDQYGHCDFCHPSCKQCFGPADFQCSTCHHGQQDQDDGYQYQGRCYKNNCPSSTYYSDSQSRCKQCDQYCGQCQSRGSCQKCRENTVYWNSSCIQYCPANTYYSQSRQQCRSCTRYNSNCVECNQAGCTRCLIPYYRYDQGCISSCPNGTYPSDTNLRKCLPCPQSCLNCTSPTSCRICRGQFRLRNGICLPKCISGYYYHRLYRDCRSCQLTNCSSCYYTTSSSRPTCIYCQPGYTLITNSSGQLQCIPTSTNCSTTRSFFSQITQKCQPCHAACLSCTNSSTNCTQCYTGMRLVNGMCINSTNPPSCITHCSICSNTTICVLCNLPYYLMPALGTCVSQCPSQYYGYLRECLRCGDGCLVCENLPNQCSSCKNGYYLLGSRCLRQCPQGYFTTLTTTYSGICQSCTTYLPGCQICTNSTICILCQPNYSLIQNLNKCYLQPTCPLNYFYSYQSQGCNLCPDNCIQCLTGQSCITCQIGYAEFNGSCRNGSNCPLSTFYRVVQYVVLEGYVSSVRSYTSGECTPCVPPCYSCLSQQVCITCVTGYILANNTCIIDCGLQFYPTNTTTPTCERCSQQCLSCRTNSTTCTSCRPGFFLYNKKCVAQCPIGLYKNQYDNQCRACGDYCLQCNSSYNCLVCYDGLWLMNGECVAVCPRGFAGTYVEYVSDLFNRMVGICRQCQAPCTSCTRTTSQYQCQSCLNGFYLYDSRCLISCPSGYFANLVTSQCVPCPAWCPTCTSYQSCQTCTTPQCQQPCQVASPPTCVQCQNTCRYCDKNTVITLGTRTGTCLECLAPYLLFSGRCYTACPSATRYDSILRRCVNCTGCPQCNNDGQCTTCTSNMFLYNGVCYTTCPANTLPSNITTNNITTKICIVNPCTTTTSTTSTTTNCISCLNPYILYNNQCTQTCPNSTYKSPSSNTCQQCPLQCKLCISYNNCTLCNTGYLIQQQISSYTYSCVSECMAGNYRGVVNIGFGNVGGCVPCMMSGCRLCQDFDTCRVCNLGLSLFYNASTNGTTCVSDCPNGFYADTGVCVPCLDSSCQICTYSATAGQNCVRCLSPSYLVPAIGRCVSTCLNGYFPLTTNTTSTCQECPPECLTCTSLTNCSQCSIGYSLNLATLQCVLICPFGSFKYYNATILADVCIRCNLTTGCLDCVGDAVVDGGVSCLLCSSGYYLLDGICYTVCPAGYYTVSGQCRRCNTPCLQCSSSNTCTRCYNGSTLNTATGTCTSNCTATQFYQSSTRTCQACSQQCYQCFGYRYDQCLSCVTPLVLIGSTCVIQCPIGYTKSLGNVCVMCDSLCKECTGAGSALQCTSCPVGSFLYMATIVNPAQGQCVKSCPTGTYYQPSSNQCKPCTTTLPLCSQCQYSLTTLTPSCTKCSPSSLTIIINNQITCKPSDYTCPPEQMYVDSLSQCVQCIMPCLRCSLNVTNVLCYQCAVGYYWYNGLCYVGCPIGTTAVRLASIVYNSVTLTDIDTCQPCQQTNCLQCTPTTPSTTQCTTCQTPYILYNNNCVQDCGSTQLTLHYNQNTLTWQCINSSPTIQDCKNKGLFNYINTTNQAICVDICPPTYFGDASQGICRRCIIGCQNCTDQVSCLICVVGFVRLGNECFGECPVGFLEVSGRCFSCIDPCATCSNSISSCTSCDVGYYLLSGSQCVQNCPTGYYPQPSTNTCSPCNPQCLTCTNSTQCQSCINPQYSRPYCKDNTNICPSNQYSTGSGCANCNTRCSSCFGPADYQCITCTGSYVMMDGICLVVCPNGYYSYTNVGTNRIQCRECSAVISNCASCTVTGSSSSCSACISPYLLSPDGTRCTLTCTQLNTNSQIYSRSTTNPNQCVTCPTGCTLCTNQNCITCTSNLYLVNGQCSNTCPPGTYAVVMSSSGSQCLACGTNCTVCSNGQICVDCVVGYVVQNGRCVSGCTVGYYPLPTTTVVNGNSYTESVCTACNTTLPHCTTCTIQSGSSSPFCTICQPPYLPLSGRCTQCQTSYFYQSSTQTCIPCSPTCTTCTSLTQCTTCSTGLLLVNGQCLYVCPAGMYPNYGTGTCSACSVANCDSCAVVGNVVQCQVCQNGYYLISASLASLINYTGASCSNTCPARTTPTTQRTCQLCTVTNCDTCTVVSTCDQCLSGYYLTTDNTCVTSCPTGTAPVIVANGPDTCVACRTGCLRCTDNTNTCTECMQGLSNAGNGECRSSSTCPTGQYVVQLSPLICGACHTSCLTCYGGSSSQCVTCPQTGGYTFQNGYCISSCTSSQFYSTTLSQCQPCSLPCVTCVTSSTYCTSCNSTAYLTSSNTCQSSCPANTYRSNLICQPCPTYCSTCTSSTYCTACTASATIFYNNVCYTDCPTGTYSIANQGSSLNTCTNCPSQCTSCTTITNCQSCASGYFLQGNRCVLQCAALYFENDDTNTCDQCESNCQACTSATQCTRCISPNNLYNDDCSPDCPSTTYSVLTSGYYHCQDCSTGCITCTDSNTCTECDNGYLMIENYSTGQIYCTETCPSGYVQRLNQDGQTYCESTNCNQCANCVNGRCQECTAHWYLQNSACVQSCSISTYGANQTWKCQPCMQNCILCPNATYCQQCSDGYNFSLSLDSKCVEYGVFTYGQMANISGFTSNITEITSLVYLSTSAGPVFFGEMSSTYFNIQFCQFMFFHDGISGNNSQMKTFLNSLSTMSMSSVGSSSSSNTSGRLLLQTQSLSFLQINLPIFIMMGCFLFMYALTYLISKHIESMFQSCPNFNFYVKQICIFLSNRFKWIYFDFVVWLSYLPFLYFSIKQVQKFNFNTALQGFSSIFSIIVLIAYPLYPVFIAYNIKKNYVALCMENDKMVEMSMSPWVYKVKRPEFIPAEGDAFVYCSKSNFILLYYPLKYFRKFIFVLIVVVCPNPVASLCILLGLNIVFIGYMGAFRPRAMPYMIFDFIVEGVMLAFEVFMVVYMALDSVKINAMTIVTHAFGFITANLSIIVAIVLNIVAYYKIFMCIYDLYQHIKEKVDQKEKLQAKQKDPASDQILSEKARQQHVNDFLYHTDFVLDEKELDKRQRNDDSLTEQEAKIQDLDKAQREIANLLSDKDLLMNNIQPRYDGEIEGNDNFKGLFDDKQLYGDQNNKKQKFQVYDEEQLPSMKMKKGKKDRNSKKNLKQANMIEKKEKPKQNLDQTNEYMLRRKQQQWIDSDRQPNLQKNNYSGQKLSYHERNNVKGNSINQLSNINKIELKEKNKTLKQSGFKSNNSNNNSKQQVKDAKFENYNKKKLMNLDQEQIEEEQVVRNVSAFSEKSARSNENLLNASPEQLKIKQKQKAKLQIKQANLVDKNKKAIKPIGQQFDQFDEQQIEEIKKRDKANKRSKQNKGQEEQEYIEEGNTYNNKNNKKTKKDQDVPEVFLEQRKRKLKGQNSSSNVKVGGKSQELNQLTLKQKTKGDKDKQRLQRLQKDLQEGNLKERRKDKNGDQPASLQQKIKDGKLNQRAKVLANFLDEDEFYFQQADQKERAAQKRDQLVEDGLLISRKPNYKESNKIKEQQPEQILTKNRQNQAKEKSQQRNKNNTSDQNNLEEGKVRQRSKNKQQFSLKLKNRDGVQESYNYDKVSYNQRNFSQNERVIPDKKNEVQQGLFSERVKRKSENQNQRSLNQPNQPKEIQELHTKERNSKRNDQNNNQSQGGFFSNLFGFNRNQKVENQIGSSEEPRSNPVSSMFNKKDNQPFQESQIGKRPSKNKNQQNKSKDKGLKKLGDQFNEDYDEIKRKNKESMIKPKINYGNLDLGNTNDFQESNYSRPASRMKKVAENTKDSGLNLDRRDGDVSDSEDFGQNTRKLRAANKQKMRGKGNLGINDDSIRIDDSEISRKRKQEQESAIRRGGKGVLKINQRGDEDEEDLENIQL